MGDADDAADSSDPSTSDGDDGPTDAAADGPRAATPTLRIAGGPPDLSYCDLVFTGEGLGEFEGHSVDLQTQAPSTYHRVAWGRTTIEGGKFSVTFPQAVESAPSYGSRVLAAIDVDDDGHCGAADRMATVTWNFCPPDGRVTISLSAASFAPPTSCALVRDTCAPWARVQRRFLDVKVVGSGIPSLDGRAVNVAMRDADTSELTGLARARILNGSFVALIPRGHPRGATQNVFWFVDANSDGACNLGEPSGVAVASAAGEDAGNFVEVAGVAGALPPGVPDVCTAFPPMGTLDVEATQFDAHEGAAIRLTVRTARGGALIGPELEALVNGGAASLPQRARGVASGAHLELLWSADPPIGQICTPGTCPHVGRLDIGPLTPDQDGIFRATFTDAHVAQTSSGEPTLGVLNNCL
jgi:hypothetical protein